MKWSSPITKIKAWFLKDTPAIPLDIFRILAGVLSVTYFYSLISDVTDFSSGNGLLNHEFLLEHWEFLRINLIQPGLGDSFFYIIFSIALLLSVSGLILGIRPRLSSFLLFIISVTTQRWNFAVMYVDDATMHLVFFWLIFLPVGNTLTAGSQMKMDRAAFQKWKEIRVSSFALNCFLLNICWLYFFAGIMKLATPMWNEGFAMYPIMQIPIARMAEFWGPEHYTVLSYATYISLASEIILPFLLLSPRGSMLKKAGLVTGLVFHLGIIATLRIPFANIALIAALVLFFREEISSLITDGEAKRSVRTEKFRLIYLVPLAFTFLICLSTMRNVPIVKDAARTTTKLLWLTGISQHYQLFDWIYRFNFKLKRDVTFHPSDNSGPVKLSHREFFPGSVRYTLFQLRNYDIKWILVVDSDIKGEFKRDLRQRMANKYCRELEKDGKVRILTTLQRITPDNIDLSKPPERYFMSFECFSDKAYKVWEKPLN